MREGGLDHAIQASGSIRALARALGISRQSVSNWQKIPADRVLIVEAVTGISRTVLRPDLYPSSDNTTPTSCEIDCGDRLRSHQHGYRSSGAAPGSVKTRKGGLDHAIRAAGGIGALARALGISQPAVSNWQRIPAERVLAVEALTGIHWMVLRPDLYPMSEDPLSSNPKPDEVDLLRAHEYGLLAVLLGRAPAAEVLARIAELRGDASPLGLAHIGLAEAAAQADPDAVSREFFDLFIGVGRGELLAYGSYYLTGFLHERPLARVREDLARLGIERAEEQREPEDHIAILCEVMAALASRRFETEPGADRSFFDRHLKPWAARFFADCETAQHACFYRAIGTVGRLFMEIEAEAFAMDA